MKAHTLRAIRRTVAPALAALCLPAGAIGLGELRVQSALGEPLDATVALTVPADAKPRPDCFSLGRTRPGGLPTVSRVVFGVEPEGTGWRLRIRSRTAVAEPALQLRLNASCEGKQASSRDYELLLDPRPGTTALPVFRSRQGDTLALLAAAIYPNSSEVREAYLKALRAANPRLAGLASEEAVPEGTEYVLPDLRRFSLSLAVTAPVARPSGTTAETAPAPSAAQPSQTRRSAQASTPAAPPKPRAEAPPTAKSAAAQPPMARPVTPPAAPAAAAPSPSRPPVGERAAPAGGSTAPAGEGGFVLRLSSPVADLSRSRGIDDRMRMQLRERLLVLDADDQVAALLSMRNSLRQLEGRVAELQLKLSALPVTAPARVAAASASPAPAPASVPASPVAASPAPAQAPSSVPASPVATSPALAQPGSHATLPDPPGPSPAAAPTLAPAPLPDPPVASPAAAPTLAPAPAPAATAALAKPDAVVTPARPTAPVSVAAKWNALVFGLPLWAWAALSAVLVAVVAVAWRALSRPRGTSATPASRKAPPETEAEPLKPDLEVDSPEGLPPAPAEHRLRAESDASLATHVPSDSENLRRRYIEERFPEIASGTIVLDDADSVVKAARLFYEDGSLARAVELLQFSVEENPESLKPWLALFEIFRLDGLKGEFADLAARFQEHHGSSEYWRKVQFIGRELDPHEPQYREPPVDGLATIGHPAAMAAAAVTFDPLAENWLNAPMDFTTVALAASLRNGLLTDAGLTDADLVANPLPALKNVETFTVA